MKTLSTIVKWFAKQFILFISLFNLYHGLTNYITRPKIDLFGGGAVYSFADSPEMSLMFVFMGVFGIYFWFKYFR
ncbi:hypothetical protein DZS_13370 [Dickeya ananatis]